jgi:hypothetical protein
MADIPKRVAQAWLEARMRGTRQAAELGGIFAPPPQPGAPPAIERGIFTPPPETPPSRAPTPEPPTPETPAPRPPARPRRKPRAPAGDRERAIPLTEGIQEMRRGRNFKDFLREKYEAGKALVDHPDPVLRERRRDRDEPRIKFWTAMKYPTFKEKVKREFQMWNQSMEAKRPRAQIGGERVRSPDEVREGDFLTKSNGTNFKVLRVTPKTAFLARVDGNGRRIDDRVHRYNAERLRSYGHRFGRTEELSRPEVSLDEAAKFVDEHLGYPAKEITSRGEYRAWLDQAFRGFRGSPYRRLGDDEPEHVRRLGEQLDEILEARGVGEDWKWQPPPRAEIGRRVVDPGQLRVGDFVQHGGQKYKVTSFRSDGLVHAVRVDENGVPQQWGEIGLDKRKLLRPGNNYVRVDAVVRPRVSDEDAKKYADDQIGYPEREVGTRDEYRAWLESKFKERARSPYYKLGEGEDDAPHVKDMARQIDRILEDRGIGKGWEWEPPPQARVGQKITDPYQLREGDFFRSQGQEGAWKVLDLLDGGQIRAISVDPNGRLHRAGGRTFGRSRFSNTEHRRIEPLMRPEVSDERALEFAEEEIGHPPKQIMDADRYRQWLVEKFRDAEASPYYMLGEDEKAHLKRLDEQIDKIFELRDVGPDWEWEPPPQVAIGERVRDPYQLREGDYFKTGRSSNGWKVIEMLDGGEIKAIEIDRYGRPTGSTATFSRTDMGRYEFDRVEPITRPAVPFDKARDFANDNAASPGRAAHNYDEYREWLVSQFESDHSSPYYKLGDDEPAHRRAMEHQVDKILEGRGIGKDWTWSEPPRIKLPPREGWRERDDGLRRMATEGKKTGKDEPLGRGINEAVKRRMLLGGEEHDFVFKDAANEAGHARVGTPTGTLHLREQAAYALDRLLGDGAVTPATVSDGNGSYQAFVPGAKILHDADRALRKITNEDLLRHPDVQRLVVLDALTGQEDRHGGNAMFQWIDPDKPKTAENLRIISIDNGYALADGDSKRGPGSYPIRDPWVSTGDKKERRKIAKELLARIPEELHEQLKKVEIEDMLGSLVESGITDRSALRAAAVKLAAMQDNPRVVGSFIGQHREPYDEYDESAAQKGQAAWHWAAQSDPEKLLRDHTDLPEDTLGDIDRKVAAALRK